MTKNIAVIGAGNSGYAMCAYLKKNNFAVNLWNRSFATIEELIEKKTIYSEGMFEGCFEVDIISTDIAETIKDVELILVTTPANSHKYIASKIAPYIKSNMTVILNPGRTFGAIEFLNVLKENNAEIPRIAETQTIIFTCRKLNFNKVAILAIKKDVLMSSINCQTSAVIENLPECLKDHFVEADSMIETSIGNVGMILHCAPVLLNTGWIEYPKAVFKYYYNGITPSIAHLLEKLDNERVAVSELLGHKIENLKEWIKRSYSVEGDDIYSCIQAVESYKTIDAPTSLRHRYLYEDIPTGLVPIEALGKKLGLEMNVTGIIIDLANSILDVDFRTEGRNLENLHIDEIKLQLLFPENK